MRIMYLSTAAFPAEITHTLSMLRVCSALANQGHEVLITGRRLNKQSDQQIFDYYGIAPVFQLALSAVGRLLNNRLTRKFELPGFVLAWRFHRVLSEFKPDLVYSRLTLAELYTVPKHLPLVYEMHSPGALGEAGWRRRLFIRQLNRLNICHIVVTTQALKDFLMEQLPDIEVRIAPLSAEPPMIPQADTLAQFKDQHLQARQFRFHAGYTGFLHAVRGIEVVIRCAKLTPNVAFHIVGGNPTAVAEWQSLAVQLKTENVFFYGHRPAAEIPWFLHCFDFFLAPLQKPALPLTFMSPLKVPQYLAYGKAIIASDVVPHQEQLRRDETALLVSADDPSAWAEALQTLIDDEESRLQLGANAAAFYQAELTPERRIERMLGDLLDVD